MSKSVLAVTTAVALFCSTVSWAMATSVSITKGGSIPLGDSVARNDVSAGAGDIYFVMTQNTVVAMNLTTQEVVYRLKEPGFVGKYSCSLIASESGYLIVNSGQGPIQIFDPRGNFIAYTSYSIQSYGQSRPYKVDGNNFIVVCTNKRALVSLDLTTGKETILFSGVLESTLVFSGDSLVTFITGFGRSGNTQTQIDFKTGQVMWTVEKVLSFKGQDDKYLYFSNTTGSGTTVDQGILVLSRNDQSQVAVFNGYDDVGQYGSAIPPRSFGRVLSVVNGASYVKLDLIDIPTGDVIKQQYLFADTQSSPAYLLDEKKNTMTIWGDVFRVVSLQDAKVKTEVATRNNSDPTSTNGNQAIVAVPGTTVLLKGVNMKSATQVPGLEARDQVGAKLVYRYAFTNATAQSGKVRMEKPYVSGSTVAVVVGDTVELFRLQ